MASRVPAGSLLAALVVGLASLAPAQAGRFTFENRQFYDPLLAEPRAGQTDILFAALGDPVPFQQGAGRQFMWDFGVGKELPILGWESALTRGSDGGMPPGKWGFGF